MTLGEKLEQAITKRPNSYMPAHTLERVLGLRQKPDRERGTLNMVMHVGQAILLGAWRGVMTEGGLSGPRASAMFTVIRLANDQTRENVTGPGAPPWTWPRDELLVDVLHKGSTRLPPARSPTPSSPDWSPLTRGARAAEPVTVTSSGAKARTAPASACPIRRPTSLRDMWRALIASMCSR
jgi:hypothetical protein